MSNEQEIEAKFWKALKSDRTLMLGLTSAEEPHSHPMTAQTEGDGNSGPIWFFGAKDTHLVKALGQRHLAFANFSSKGHDLFACIHGELVLDNDRATIDRLWNKFVAAWYPGGKEDPNLALLRFDPAHGEIWLNENSLFAGIKMLLGADPKKDYKDKMAEVNLS